MATPKNTKRAKPKPQSRLRRKRAKRTGPRGPYFLNDKMIADFVASVNETPGGPIEFHCESLGIGRRTYHEWREKAVKQPGSIYSRFVEAVDKAMGAGFKTLYKRAINTRPHEILFRRRYELFPNDARIQMELSGANGGPIQMAVAPIEIQLVCIGSSQNGTTPFPMRDERVTHD